MSPASFLLSVVALCFAFNRGGGGWKELRKEQKHSGHTKHIAQTRKEKRRNACSIAICHFANARKFRLLFFIMWIIHMIVLETSSYEELLEHLKIVVRVILWDRKPSEFFKAPPLTGVSENHILFVYKHEKERLGMLWILKRILFVFNLICYITFHIQVSL